MSRADMESASLKCQSLQAAAEFAFVKPEKLSASVSVGVTRLAMMVDQSRRKSSWWRERTSSLLTAVCLCMPKSQAGITKLSLLIFLASLLPIT
jgi:hypothetical protein